MATDPVALDKYVDSAGEASKRSRWALLALIVASIFGTASYLSSRPSAWPWDRLRLLNVAHRCLEPGADAQACSEDDVRAVSAMLARWEYIDAAAASSVKTVEDLQALRPNAPQLEHHIQHQRDVIMDRTAIQQAPFLGFSFDVNDLGFVANASFVSLLMVLALSLRRENQNLVILERHAQAKGAGGTAWDLVCMRQVFTIIDLPKDGEKPGVLLAHLNSALLCLPLIVEGLIMYMDLSTMGIGTALSLSGAAMSTLFEIFGFALSVVLVFACMRQQKHLRERLAYRWSDSAPPG